MFTHTCTHPHPQLLALHTHANAHTCMNNKMAWMTKMAALTHRYARTHSYWSTLMHMHTHFNTHTHMHTHMHAHTIYAQQDDDDNDDATMVDSQVCPHLTHLHSPTSDPLQLTHGQLRVHTSTIRRRTTVHPHQHDNDEGTHMSTPTRRWRRHPRVHASTLTRMPACPC